MEYLEIHPTPEEYRQMVTQSLAGSYIPHVQHTIAVCREGDTPVMFYNYFRYAHDTMFLHRAWYDEQARVKIRKRHYWLGFYEFARLQGYRYIMGVIRDENIPALIWALKTGWKITGTRRTPGGKLVVDVLLDLDADMF